MLRKKECFLEIVQEGSSSRIDCAFVDFRFTIVDRGQDAKYSIDIYTSIDSPADLGLSCLPHKKVDKVRLKTEEDGKVIRSFTIDDYPSFSMRTGIDGEIMDSLSFLGYRDV